MPKYRKRPVVIEAVRAYRLIGDATHNWDGLPPWFREAYEAGGILIRPDGIDITTLEGVMTAGREDWVIRGVKGEVYPCKPEVFDETYDPVEDVNA